MIRRPPRSTQSRSSAASDVYKRQGEGVYADVVFGPVEHRGVGDDVGVFHLPERAFGFGLGAVAGDDVGNGPVVVVGDDDVFAEDLGLQLGVGGGVDIPGEAQVFGFLAGQAPSEDALYPGVVGDLGDVGLDGGPVSAGLAASQGGGQFVEAAAGFGQGGALKTADLVGVQLGRMGEDGAPLGAIACPADFQGVQAGVTVGVCL